MFKRAFFVVGCLLIFASVAKADMVLVCDMQGNCQYVNVIGN